MTTNPNPNSTVLKLDNIFSPQELQELNDLFDLNTQDNSEDFPELGRLNVLLYGFPKHLIEKLTNIVNDSMDVPEPLELVLAPSGAEYSGRHGSPELRPHYDGDWTEVIVDFQLSSNTQWPIGVDLEVYPLGDNSGVAFNPNTSAHWRPRKEFQPDEYVRMIFFRFFNPNSPQNNDQLNELHPGHQALNIVSDYRNSLDY